MPGLIPSGCSIPLPAAGASCESQEHAATGSTDCRITHSHPTPSGTASPQPKKGKNLQSTDVLHQQSPASSSAAATQLPKGQERQNPAWSSGQTQGSLAVFTTKTGSLKLQLPALQNAHSTGKKITAVFQSSPSSTASSPEQCRHKHPAASPPESIIRPAWMLL